jgi:DNA-directed RNA polymerase specialized sigma24 family protein
LARLSDEMNAYRTTGGRSITAGEFARLLARLGADETRAAHEYERLRRTLIKFFDWRGVWPADEYADQTLDRLARKLEETAVDDLWNYAHGIARLLLLEHRRRPAGMSLELAGDPPAVPASQASGEDERMHDCFDRCLAELPDDGRSLILRYYQGDGSEKIANRRQLASALRLSENALRSRVQRLRDRLEQCVEVCVSRMG